MYQEISAKNLRYILIILIFYVGQKIGEMSHNYHHLSKLLTLYFSYFIHLYYQTFETQKYFSNVSNVIIIFTKISSIIQTAKIGVGCLPIFLLTYLTFPFERNFAFLYSSFLIFIIFICSVGHNENATYICSIDKSFYILRRQAPYREPITDTNRH